MTRRKRPRFLDTCLAINSAASRLDGTPYYHLCEVQKGHKGWHICWCGCAFTEQGVVATQLRADIGWAERTPASHEPH